MVGGESRTIIGYHGCSLETKEKILAGESWIPSSHRWEWLGNGVYFWEYDERRALEWAREVSRHPAVIKAKIELGHCLDMTTRGSVAALRAGYRFLKTEYSLLKKRMPENKNVPGDDDWKNRQLDHAVIEAVHSYNMENGDTAYDTVRGAFFEGKPVYPGGGFRDKTHIQICVRNPECIIEVS